MKKIVFCLVACVSALFAEKTDFDRSFQVNGSMILSRGVAFGGIGASLHLKYFDDNRVFGAYVQELSEFDLCLFCYGVNPSETNSSFGILYGIGTAGKWTYANAMVGVGAINGIRRGKYLYTDTTGEKCELFCLDESYYEEKSLWGPEVSLQGEAGLKIYYIGVGATGSANISTVDFYITLGLDFIINIPYFTL